MSSRFTLADDTRDDIVFQADSGSQTAPRLDQLWPGRQVVVTEPERKQARLYSLYAAWCAEFMGTGAKSTSVTGLIHSLTEDCRQTGVMARNPVILLMEEAAHADNPREFAIWAGFVDWSTCAPDEFIRAIDLALNLELATLARELAQEGHRHFPDYKRLEQAARVLAPSTVQAKADMSPVEGLDVSMAWLHEHAGQYRGNWVAVRGGHLLATTTTLEELEEVIGQTADFESTIVTRVL
jgi:hypothetical protein